MSASEPSSSHGVAPGSPGDSAPRRERAAIAAQACETCRARKTKCDEARPRCGLCTRLGVVCNYREPQPTKKDKTLEQMDSKLDRIGGTMKDFSSQMREMTDLIRTIPGVSPGAAPTQGQPASSPATTTQSMQSEETVVPAPFGTDAHLTTPHKVLLWPALYHMLGQESASNQRDMLAIAQEGTHWFLKRETGKHPEPLSAEARLQESLASNSNPNYIPLDRQARKHLVGLTYDRMVMFAKSYFTTYHVLYPILDQGLFDVILRDVVENGFGDADYNSTIALLVFALGHMAIAGARDPPLDPSVHPNSGFRGGSLHQPPGIELFNAARRSFGFIGTQCSLENVQILTLMAIYYEGCSRHLDFWRSSVSASMSCIVLAKCEQFDMDSPRGHTYKRAFWTCNLIENWYHFELDLPRTGIREFGEQVSLPGNPRSSPEDNQVQIQYLAMIALHRLISRIHVDLHAQSHDGSPDTYRGPPTAVITGLVDMLQQWRELLPRELQWKDGPHRFNYPGLDRDGTPTQHVLFHYTKNADQPEYLMSIDISTAQLRSRYYYALFIIYRPFVYKALHYPEITTAEDRRNAGECIQASLKWPIVMYPVRDKKRLIPYGFAWTQNFLGILLILRMSLDHKTMAGIVDEFVNKQEMQETIVLLLDWFEDMQQVDGVAEWGHEVMSNLWGRQYAADEG
ncbi:hypothetical protein K402DRAFT_414646 [Aulographum hederae CBS 113979]|uniref:Zn(2)-C6 fungal-type domain-containing protein n=1 Tax=Aulographum hederae CBS 113979 TaxID=1176131 RepID=A0A6G1GQ18_9PEZI|nr:hypothetical protein K402DRAFT_414646 [Aulographum hederae CBS 113979]